MTLGWRRLQNKSFSYQHPVVVLSLLLCHPWNSPGCRHCAGTTGVSRRQGLLPSRSFHCTKVPSIKWLTAITKPEQALWRKFLGALRGHDREKYFTLGDEGETVQRNTTGGIWHHLGTERRAMSPEWNADAGRGYGLWREGRKQPGYACPSKVPLRILCFYLKAKEVRKKWLTMYKGN